MTGESHSPSPVTTLINEVQVAENFGFGEEHAMLRKTARRMLAERCPMTEIRRLVDDPVGFDPALYRAIADAGWTGLLISEPHGGAGLDSRSAALVIEETGRCLLPAPLWSAIIAGLAIDLAGSEAQKTRWLPGLADGSIIATVGFTEPGGSWLPDATAATAREIASGYELSGVKTHVLWAGSAGCVVAPFVAGDEMALFAVDLTVPGITVEPERGVDSTRRTFRITADRAVVPADARLASGDRSAWRALHTRGHALLAAEMVGAADAMLGKTRDYAVERIQFNRPIGAFQAVKHPLVDVLTAVEHAWSLTLGAAGAIDAAPGRAEIPARMAKAAATDAVRFAADRGVQLHGGFGFTWDCDAHFYFKRALWSAATLGDASHHRRQLAAHLLGPEKSSR